MASGKDNFIGKNGDRRSRAADRDSIAQTNYSPPSLYLFSLLPQRLCGFFLSVISGVKGVISIKLLQCKSTKQKVRCRFDDHIFRQIQVLCPFETA